MRHRTPPTIVLRNAPDAQLHTSDMRLARRSLALGVQPPIHYLSQSISTQKRADVCGDAVAEMWTVRRRTHLGGKPLFPKKKQFRTGKAPKATWSKVIKYCQDEEARTPR